MSLPYLRHFFANQFAKVPELNHSFAGQTIIVTGSNTGLGYESAKHYLLLGASRIILAVRNLDKGNAAKVKLEAATGKTGILEVWSLDMSSYTSIQEFVNKAEKNLDRIDVLLENAGMLSTKWQVSVEGTEMGMAVNVYGTIFLALLMIPVLRASARKHNITPVVTIVGSEAHHLHSIKQAVNSGDPLAYWDDEKKYDRLSRYLLSFSLLGWEI